MSDVVCRMSAVTEHPDVSSIPESRYRLEAELRRVEYDISELDEPMRAESWRVRHGSGVHWGWMLASVGLFLLTMACCGSVFNALDGGSWLYPLIMVPLGVVAAHRLVRVWPKAAPRMANLRKQRRDLVHRKDRLEEILAGKATDALGNPIVVDGTPTPVIRRPTDFAQTLWRGWGRFLGPSPADALRELPAGTSWFRLAYHRYLGWGAPVALLVALLVLALIVVVT